VAAIAFELEWLEKSGLFKIGYTHTDTPIPERPDISTIVFRLFQEILNNIVRHAQANEIVITLAFASNVLTLSITDNGTGFDVAEIMKQHKGMGLTNMQKRAAMIKGNTYIQSVPGTGTTVKITVPY
jgi:signal transduction histidine kinase